MRAAFAALLLAMSAALAGDSWAGDPAASLFEGAPDAPGRVMIGSATTGAGRFACRNCHGADGLGGTEGNAPAITWPALTQPTATRPAYEPAAFARALREGVDPAGRSLRPQMPRFVLDDATVAALQAHLAALPMRQIAGIFPDRIVLAVPVPPDNRPAGLAYAAALERMLDLRLEGRMLHGRRIELMRAETVDEAAKGAAAVIGLPPSQAMSSRDFAKAGVPVLFPMPLLDGDEDPASIRGLYATWADVLRVLLEKAGAATEDNITVLSNPEAPPKRDRIEAAIAAYSLTPRAEWRSISDPRPLAPVVVIFEARPGLLRERLAALAPGTRVYGLASQLAPFAGIFPLKLTGTLAETTLLPSRAGAAFDPHEAHAARALDVLYPALRGAGRSLTRAGLIRAIGFLTLPQAGLDYPTHPLTGSTDVMLLELGRE